MAHVLFVAGGVLGAIGLFSLGSSWLFRDIGGAEDNEYESAEAELVAAESDRQANMREIIRALAMIAGGAGLIGIGVWL